VRRLNILTWHVHGAYLLYLSQIPHDIYVPVKDGLPPGYGGCCGTLPWPPNLHEIPAEDVRTLPLDCVIFQSRQNYLVDQYEILSDEQRALPRIYIEHDPPLSSPTDTQHVVDDADVLLVHVTPFNDLMWDSGRTPARVIDHGVFVPDDVRCTGEVARGVTVVNNIQHRGRRLGADVLERARFDVPIDLAGMGTEPLGGAGDLRRDELLRFEARRRFFFNPIRYTSMGLSVCEAMMLGMPVIGLATTEMATAIENGVSGYVDTDERKLLDAMRALLDDPAEAARLGAGARRAAQERFGIERFIHDWNNALGEVAGVPGGLRPVRGGRAEKEGISA
jgi:glycosyltransferase involved in cell wall biosynthesis